MLDFRLKVFQSVAHNLSFTKASNELFITQPAISKHIKELESEFEAKLFNRTGNKVSLTASGKILLQYTDRIIALHNEVKFELSQLKENLEGNIRIGASTTIAQYVIPESLAKFNKQHPEIKLSLFSGNTEEIEKQLLANKIDIGIIEGEPTNADIKYLPFLNDELLVFTSAKNTTIAEINSAEELLQLPLVLRERGSGTLEVIEKNLRKSHIDPRHLNVLLYLGSTEAIKSFIKTSNGVGIVSRFAIQDEVSNNIFRLIEIPDLKFNRQFHFISSKGPEPVGISNLFLNFVWKHYNL